jgi:hypothetical protein
MFIGGNEEDLVDIHNHHHFYQFFVILGLSLLTDLFNHRISLLLVTVSLIILGYLWTNFYGNGTLDTLYTMEILLLFSEEIIVVLRSYIIEEVDKKRKEKRTVIKNEEERGEGGGRGGGGKVGNESGSDSDEVNNEERRDLKGNIEIGKWLIRLFLFQTICSMLLNNSYFSIISIPLINEFLFGAKEITSHAGYYPLCMGCLFFLFFYGLPLIRRSIFLLNLFL